MFQLSVWDDEESSDSPRTIKGDKFEKFLDVCFKESTYFSLTKARWTNSVDNRVRNELKPFLAQEFKTSKWFCYDLSEAPEPSQNFLEVSVYYAKLGARIILMKNFSDIFLNEMKDGVSVESTQTVEDLCFFRGKLLWLGTVSHENILELSLSEDISKAYLNTYGVWEYCEDRIKDLIDLDLYVNK